MRDMKYLKDDVFETVLGQPFEMVGVKGDPNKTTKEATISVILHWLVSSYAPDPRQMVLQVADLRRLNRVIDILEVNPPEDQEGDYFYEFEDADYSLMQKVIAMTSVLMTPRNAPLIDDILNQGPSEKPN